MNLNISNSFYIILLKTHVRNLEIASHLFQLFLLLKHISIHAYRCKSFNVLKFGFSTDNINF